MGKWIGVTRARNECDIIEMFVRQNLTVLDEMHIIVNISTDATVEILAELRKEGLPLFPYNDTFLDNRQEIVLSNLIRTHIQPSECDWCFLLDADEFITVTREILEKELQKVHAGTLAAWKPKTYVPLEDIDGQNILLSDHDSNPFHSITFRRDREPDPNSRKIIVPSTFLTSITIAPGSHNAWDHAGIVIPIHFLASQLIHIPFRNEEQLKSKLSLGSLSLMMKNFRTELEGSQWHKGYKLIKSEIIPSVTRSGLLIDGDGGEDYVRNVTLIYDPINWSPSAVIKYKRQRKVNAYQNLLNYSEIISLRFGNIVDKLDKGEISNNILATKSCKHGLFAYYKNDYVIGRSLEMYGEWAEHELDCLSTYIYEGDVIIDVGATIGTHAVYFSKKIGKQGMVHAFEPQRRTFHLLNMNAALNACDNLITHQEAVSDHTGIISVPNVGYNETANIANVSLLNGGEDIVHMSTIDDLGLANVRLIKADVVGMERQVILGAMGTIQRCQPILFVKNNIDERSYKLLEVLMSLDYQLYWHFASSYNEANYFGNKSNFLEGVGRPEINILALPNEISSAAPNLEPVGSLSETWKEAYNRACQNKRSYLTVD